MGITRALIGAVAAAGIARLLAPAETDKAVRSAKRAIGTGTKAAKRKAASVAKSAGMTATRKSSRTKTAARKTSPTKTLAKSKTRKAQRRPARKTSR